MRNLRAAADRSFRMPGPQEKRSPVRKCGMIKNGNILPGFDKLRKGKCGRVDTKEGGCYTEKTRAPGQTDWWGEDINTAYTIYGRQFVGVSDRNLSAIKVTWAYLFNKDMEREYNIAAGLGYESLYDVVRKGAWTLDTVRGIVKDFWFDNPTGGTVGGLDESDTFGLISAGTQWTDLTAASCGIRFVRNDGESTPEITAFPTFAQVVTALNALGSSRGFFLPKDSPAMTKFAQGTALFLMTSLGSLEGDEIHASEIAFGVLPYPKANARQKKYHAGSHDSMTSPGNPDDGGGARGDGRRRAGSTECRVPPRRSPVLL